MMRRVSLIEEAPARQVRMANVAIVGTHSTNGVAQIHSDLLRTRVVTDFAELFPERFNNKTNGVTPRRWLLLANPDLSALITEAIGDSWVTDLSQLQRLLPLADDAGFRARFRRTKQTACVDPCSGIRENSSSATGMLAPSSPNRPQNLGEIHVQVAARRDQTPDEA